MATIESVHTGRGKRGFAFLSMIDFCFPQLCVVCGESLLLGRADSPWTRLPVCAPCLDRVEPLCGRRCRTCSLPLVSEIDECSRCRSRDFPFVKHYAIYEYGGTVRELIGQYKFRNQRSLAGFFAAALAHSLRSDYPGIPVVPVPSRPKTVRKRGWDHIGVIVEKLSHDYRVEVLPLLRRRNGPSQKTLDFSHRLTNLKAHIRWAGAPESVPPERVVLLDDVFTTGATASECSRVLIENGVTEVSVLTLAID